MAVQSRTIDEILGIIRMALETSATPVIGTPKGILLRVALSGAVEGEETTWRTVSLENAGADLGMHELSAHLRAPFLEFYRERGHPILRHDQ